MIRAGAPAPRASAGVVLLHGRGGSAADMLSLAEGLALPDVAFLAPEAPGNSWWPTSFLAPMDQMAPFVSAALATVDRALAALVAEGLPRRRLHLLGFSQGACLALEAFARQGAGLGGVLAFSGGLVGTSDAPGGPDAALYGHRPKALDYRTDLAGGRVWISVHAEDPHIPLTRMQDSARTLARLGATVATHVEPGPGHAVFAEDIAAARALLQGA
jgi:phospholipase/carboxylesterase